MQVGNLDNSQKDVELEGCALICEVAKGPQIEKIQPTTCSSQGDASARIDMFFSADPD